MVCFGRDGRRRSATGRPSAHISARTATIEANARSHSGNYSGKDPAEKSAISAVPARKCVMYYCPNTFFRNARTSPCAFFMAASL